ncbi:MAG: M81 family metallopeptidase [Chloroflexota bacterium]
MPKRVLLAAMKQESNTFVPGFVGLAEVRRQRLLEGEAMLTTPFGEEELEGMVATAAAEGVELVPTIDARVYPGPPLTDEAFDYICADILAGARRERGRLDGAILSLHGAMTTESLDDAEGVLLSRLRAELGPDVPIVASYDLHCHATKAKLRAVDGLVAFHTHPHVDHFDTGVRAMGLLGKILRGEARPVLAWRRLPMVTCANANTGRPPMGDIMGRALEMEREPDILAVSILPTHAHKDAADLAWYIVVVADGDKSLAQARADELGRMAWERRERFLTRRTPLAQAIAAGMELAGGPVVLNDFADNTLGGGYGDSTFVLGALLEACPAEVSYLLLTDPEAARACAAAGMGAELTLPVGGKCTPLFYRPLTVTGRVRALADGTYDSQLPPGTVRRGLTAVLQVGGISLVISEQPAPAIDAAVYRSVGLEPRRARFVQVKSPGGYHEVYDEFAAASYDLDTTGPTDSDLTRLPYKKIKRPLWPWDADLREPW